MHKFFEEGGRPMFTYVRLSNKQSKETSWHNSYQIKMIKTSQR